MANVIPYAFRGELFSGTHDFASGGDSFKIALYTSNPYDTSSTVYVVTNEQSSGGGSNYTAGGNALTGNAVVSTGAVATCDFADSTWTSATITAAFGTIYNDDKSDKLCVPVNNSPRNAKGITFAIFFYLLKKLMVIPI